jgi:hypothetical protein
MTKRYDAHGQRVTDCCGTYSTYMDIMPPLDHAGPGEDMVLCCKRCYREVGIGQGDGCEFKPGVTADDYYKAAFAKEAVS